MDYKQKLLDYFLSDNMDLSSSFNELKEMFLRFLDDIDDKYLEKLYEKLIHRDCKIHCSNISEYSIINNTISIDIDHEISRDAFYHECGHFVDFLAIESREVDNKKQYLLKCLSRSITLSNGKTLAENVKDELKLRHNDIKNFLVRKLDDELYNKIDHNLAQDYIKYHNINHEINKLSRRLKRDIYKEIDDYSQLEKDPLYNIEWQRHFKTYDEALLAYNRLNELKYSMIDYKKFNNLVATIHNTKEYQYVMSKYFILFDMVNGINGYDFIMPQHSQAYFKRNGIFGMEFFAQMYANVVTNKVEACEVVKEQLPESFKMFEELFDLAMRIVYE